MLKTRTAIQLALFVALTPLHSTRALSVRALRRACGDKSRHWGPVTSPPT
jgi:hypothetical protein